MSWKPHPHEPSAATGRYAAKSFLLSLAELRFFEALKLAVEPSVYIVAKVRLADLVSCIDASPQSGTLGRITQKHVDFVIVDAKSTRILAAIELDDSTHEEKRTIERDRFVNELLNSVGIPLLRVQAASKYNPMVLQQQLAITLRMQGVRVADRMPIKGKRYCQKSAVQREPSKNSGRLQRPYRSRSFR